MALTSETELTPLMIASQEGHIEIIELLLLHGADINKKTPIPKTPKYIGGGTALIFASGEGKTEVVKSLLKHSANINDAADNGVTALITVEFQRKSPGSSKIIPQLVSEQFPTFSTMLP